MPEEQRESKPRCASRGNRDFMVGAARACAGAVLFSLPLMMTMEMWSLGFFLEPLRLTLLMVASFPLLVGVSHFAGFEPTFGIADDLRDACIALAIGFTVPTVILLLFGILGPETTARDAIGKIAVQAVPASLGALLARSQLGTGGKRPEMEHITYWGELFLMVVGALFLALNLAPTDEMVLISYRMTPWHSLALIAVSLAAMHAFVYVSAFRGQAKVHPRASKIGVFLRFTVAGYALVLLVCLYVLWTFGRADGNSLEEVLQAVVVLSFPGAIGAAAARLVL